MDLCNEHKIYPEITIRPVSEINRIMETLDAGNDAGVRYVLDIAGQSGNPPLDEKALTAEGEKALETGDPAQVRRCRWRERVGGKRGGWREIDRH